MRKGARLFGIEREREIFIEAHQDPCAVPDTRLNWNMKYFMPRKNVRVCRLFPLRSLFTRSDFAWRWPASQSRSRRALFCPWFPSRVDLDRPFSDGQESRISSSRTFRVRQRVSFRRNVNWIARFGMEVNNWPLFRFVPVIPSEEGTLGRKEKALGAVQRCSW